MKMLKTLAVLFFFVFTLTACGGGGGDDDDGGGNGGSGGNDYSDGYTGATGDADISLGNAGDLAVAAISSVRAGLDEADASIIPVVPSPSGRPVVSGIDLSRIAARTAREPVEGICDSGSVDYEDLGSTEETEKFRTTFNNCTVNDPAYGTFTIDGVLEYVYNIDGSFTNTFRDLTITSSEYGSGHIDYYRVTCTAPGEGYTCTWETAGIDGRVYQAETLVVYETTDGVYGHLSVYHPDHGRVGVAISDTDPLVFDCGSGVPGSGTLTLTDADGSTAEVVFNDCDSFTVTVDGVSETYSWSSLLGE